MNSKPAYRNERADLLSFDTRPEGYSHIAAYFRMPLISPLPVELGFFLAHLRLNRAFEL